VRFTSSDAIDIAIDGIVELTQWRGVDTHDEYQATATPLISVRWRHARRHLF